MSYKEKPDKPISLSLHLWVGTGAKTEERQLEAKLLETKLVGSSVDEHCYQTAALNDDSVGRVDKIC